MNEDTFEMHDNSVANEGTEPLNPLAEAVKVAITPAEKAGELFKLKELKKQIDERIKAIQSDLLQVMTDNGVLQLKTETYTMFKTVRPTIKCVNFNEAVAYCDAHDIPVVTTLDMAYMKEPISHALEHEPNGVPGIEKTVSEFVSVRITKKKGV